MRSYGLEQNGVAKETTLAVMKTWDGWVQLTSVAGLMTSVQLWRHLERSSMTITIKAGIQHQIATAIESLKIASKSRQIEYQRQL